MTYCLVQDIVTLLSYFNGCFFPLSCLAGDFAEAGSETVTLQEGEALNLSCTLRGNDSSVRQWLNPRGFTIFLDTEWGKCENPTRHFPRGAEGQLAVGFPALTQGQFDSPATQPPEMVLRSAPFWQEVHEMETPTRVVWHYSF